METKNTEEKEMIYTEYQGKPYAIYFAVLLALGAIIIGGSYLFMMIFDKIYEAITKTPVS